MKNSFSFLLVSIFFLSTFMSFGNDEKDNLAPTSLVSSQSFIEKENSNVEVIYAKKEFVNSHSKLTKAEKKEVMEKIKEMKAEVKQIKNQENTKNQFKGWDSKFKIGAILITVALLLSIVGIGWVAGLAALIGLFFLVIGLLQTYN